MSTTTTATGRTIRWIAVVALIAVIGALLFSRLDLFGDEDTASTGKGGPPGRSGGGPAPAKVEVYVAKAGGLDAPLALPGTVLPNESVEITSEVPGKITEINFTEGRSVAAGAVLARLNDAELQANLVRAESRKKFAGMNLARKKALLDRDGISPAEYESAQHEVEVSTAEVELIEAQIAKTVIRAPFSGVIGLRQVSLGSYVTPSTIIATLQDINPLKVEFRVPEGYASAVRSGMTFNYTVGESSTSRTARVFATEPSLDIETRSLVVRALGSNAGGEVLPGQYVSVELKTGAGSQLPLIPTTAIVPTMQGQKIYMVKEGKAVEQNVQLGTRSNKYVEVAEGISSGDTVVISGLQGVRNGGPVQVIPSRQ